MKALVKRQSGAVTLLGALFIVMLVGTMGLVVNRMAGSSIADTVAQNDAIEALFVAESGIEYASYRYANGTPCAKLDTVIDVTPAGRGEFDITDSGLVADRCRISIQAWVSSTGAAIPNSARRTVIADLRLASTEGRAAGDSGGVSLVRWQEIINH